MILYLPSGAFAYLDRDPFGPTRWLDTQTDGLARPLCDGVARRPVGSTGRYEHVTYESAFRAGPWTLLGYDEDGGPAGYCTALRWPAHQSRYPAALGSRVAAWVVGRAVPRRGRADGQALRVAAPGRPAASGDRLQVAGRRILLQAGESVFTGVAASRAGPDGSRVALRRTLRMEEEQRRLRQLQLQHHRSDPMTSTGVLEQLPEAPLHLGDDVVAERALLGRGLARLDALRREQAVDRRRAVAEIGALRIAWLKTPSKYSSAVSPSSSISST